MEVRIWKYRPVWAMGITGRGERRDVHTRWGSRSAQHVATLLGVLEWRGGTRRGGRKEGGREGDSLAGLVSCVLSGSSLVRQAVRCISTTPVLAEQLEGNWAEANQIRPPYLMRELKVSTTSCPRMVVRFEESAKPDKRISDVIDLGPSHPWGPVLRAFEHQDMVERSTRV